MDMDPQTEALRRAEVEKYIADEIFGGGSEGITKAADFLDKRPIDYYENRCIIPYCDAPSEQGLRVGGKDVPLCHDHFVAAYSQRK